MPESIERASTDWEGIYENSTESGGWSYLSGVIVRTLLREIRSAEGQSMIELGCGFGRNSARLAALGAKVTLLDLSETILDQAEAYFRRKGLSGIFVSGDIFSIPLLSDKYQVVWNAGVIEHWTGERQVDCIREMLRICRPDGLVITLNPNKASLHEWGKRILMHLRLYAYTDEYNILSLKDQAKKAGGYLSKKEYSIGFIILFVGFFFQIRTQNLIGRISYKIFRILNGILTWLDRSSMGNALYRFDKWLSKLFGGYLLVSIIQKEV